MSLIASLLLAASTVSAAPPIRGAWTMCERGRVAIENTDPRGDANSKWFFGEDGRVSVAAPERDGHAAEVLPYAIAGDRLTIGFDGQLDADSPSFGIEPETRDAWVMVGGAVRTRMCRLGDREAFDRPIAPYSIVSVLSDEDQRPNEFPDDARPSAPERGIEGIWELVRITTDQPLRGMPPYGFHNERLRVADGQLCFLTHDGRPIEVPACEAVDYEGHAMPTAAMHASRGPWGYLVLTEKGWRYEARWRGNDNPVAPLRVILLDTAD